MILPKTERHDGVIVVDGSEYVPWLVNASRTRMDAYSMGGVRFVTDHTTLYIHCFDEDAAKTIDRREFQA